MVEVRRPAHRPDLLDSVDIFTEIDSWTEGNLSDFGQVGGVVDVEDVIPEQEQQVLPERVVGDTADGQGNGEVSGDS